MYSTGRITECGTQSDPSSSSSSSSRERFFLDAPFDLGGLDLLFAPFFFRALPVGKMGAVVSRRW